MNKYIVLPPPQRIVIELTPVCDLSCRMCPRHYVKIKNHYMPDELWLGLIDEITEKIPDVAILPFWRGESLMHPNFSKLINYALDRGIKIHISTNGNLLEDSNIETLLRCEFVSFSIHTELGHKKAHDFIRKRADKNKPAVQVSFVRGEKTTEKFLDRILDSSDLEGFDCVRLYKEHTKGGIFGKSDYGVKKDFHKFCPKLLDTLVIASDGTISRCCFIWSTDNKINVNDLGIDMIWNSQSLQKIRDKYPDKVCQMCDQWTGRTCGESWQLNQGTIIHDVFSPMRK